MSLLIRPAPALLVEAPALDALRMRLELGLLAASAHAYRKCDEIQVATPLSRTGRCLLGVDANRWSGLGCLPRAERDDRR